jgi:phage terminase large subunit
MRKVSIQTAAVFRPLLEPARYKGAYGGRGSGKSHFFASLLIEDALAQPGISGEGLRCVCVREIQRDLKESAKLLVEDQLRRHGLTEADGFRSYREAIATPGDGIIIFRGMHDYTADSIKSLEGFHRCWIEEAHTLSHASFSILRPTIRAPSSQIWASWNPRSRRDAVDAFFRAGEVPDARVVRVSWRDNPWFPPELDAERRLDQARYPDRYDHIWEGEYATQVQGSYFGALLSACEREGRIVAKLAVDPLLPVRAFFDIGGAGATSDAMAIWIVQWSGQDIYVLDYIEGQGQPLAYYADQLRQRGWSRAICILPHDGAVTNNITGKRYCDHLREAEFEVPEPVPNQGRGAAAMRIEAVRRLLPRCYFDRDKTAAGREALAYYHERIDEQREIGLGPEHDWSSHAADAFGLMAICYEQPTRQQNFWRSLEVPNIALA